jgi:transcription termination factor Rho
VPFDIPSCIQSVQLPWELIGNEDGTLKRKEDIENALCLIRLDEQSKSTFQGQIGQRLEVSVYVDKVVDLAANQYGSINHLHTFIDDKENIYVWNTASRRLNEGDSLRIRGTVKEHKNYQGVQQTIFTRCSIL